MRKISDGPVLAHSARHGVKTSGHDPPRFYSVDWAVMRGNEEVSSTQIDDV